MARPIDAKYSPEPGDLREASVAGRTFRVRSSPLAALGDAERSLSDAGVRMPTSQQTEWCTLFGVDGFRLEAWEGDRCAASFVVESGFSRALPGHVLWRIDRLGGYSDTDATAACLRGLHALARDRPRVLRVSVGFFSRVPGERDRLAALCGELGFRPEPNPRAYRRTLAVDLIPTEAEIMAQMAKKGRRDLRAAQRSGVDVRPIHDSALAPRLGQLLHETMKRTDGPDLNRPWAGLIDFCRDHPNQARLVGAWSGPDPEADLLAFALGIHQGDHAHYSDAASTRDGVRAPLGFGLAWDLLMWAREQGLEWFDFGGLPSREEADPSIEGIARFKRKFGGEEIHVREEWAFEPRPVRAAVSRSVSAAVHGVRGMLGGA